jgi:hypothetical protein
MDATHNKPQGNVLLPVALINRAESSRRCSDSRRRLHMQSDWRIRREVREESMRLPEATLSAPGP